MYTISYSAFPIPGLPHRRLHISHSHQHETCYTEASVIQDIPISTHFKSHVAKDSSKAKMSWELKLWMYGHSISWSLESKVWIATESGSLEVTYTHNKEHKATQQLVSNFANDPFRPLMTLLEYRGLLTESVGGMITSVAFAVAVQKMFC